MFEVFVDCNDREGMRVGKDKSMFKVSPNILHTKKLKHNTIIIVLQSTDNQAMKQQQQQPELTASKHSFLIFVTG